MDRFRPVVTAALTAALLCGAQYWVTGHIGLDLFDEGYLWYGVLGTAAGEIPLRDFQAYDPGRYFWCAAWSKLFGEGILALRLAGTLFQTIGLTCGLLAARRLTKNPALLVLIGCMLLLWMFPRYKVYESSLSLIAVLVITRLIEAPIIRRHFGTGLLVGAAALMGRNHGLYCALAATLAMALLWLKGRDSQPLRSLAFFSGGVLTGYAPMLLLALFAPGFAESYLRSILEFNPLPIKIPWPWLLVEMYRNGAPPAPWLWATSWLYVLMCVGYPLGLWLALRSDGEELTRRALLVASTCVGLFYAHHAMVRADLYHLAQGIHPLLLAMLAVPAALGWKARSAPTVAVFAVLVVATAVVVHHVNLPAWQAHGFAGEGANSHRPYDAAGDELLLPTALADDLEQIERVVSETVPADEPLLVLPYQSVYYPLLGRRSPVWGIFFLRPGQGESDAEMIRKLEEKQVDWVLLVAGVLRGANASFPRQRPEVWDYLSREFATVPDLTLPRNHVLLRRRSRPNRAEKQNKRLSELVDETGHPSRKRRTRIPG